MLCINSGMLAENMENLCLLNPDSRAKVYVNWASFLITSMWEVLWGWVVNRALLSHLKSGTCLDSVIQGKNLVP